MDNETGMVLIFKIGNEVGIQGIKTIETRDIMMLQHNSVRKSLIWY